MSMGVILLLSFLAGFAYFSRRFMGDMFLERPIFLGPMVGLIMGDLPTGLLVGATLELIFMGAADIGGSVPPNMVIGSILGTAFAIVSGQGLETGLVIAIPAALLGVTFEAFAKTVCVFFVTAAERYADEGNAAGVAWMMHLGNVVHFMATALPTFFALALGAEAVTTLTSTMPVWLTAGVKVAGSVLPALGFALLLNSLGARHLMPFFFIGFLLAAYTSFGVLGVAILGFLAAYLIMSRQSQETPLQAAGPSTASPYHDLVSPSDIKQMYWRSFGLQSAFSFDRMQAMGFTWTIMPFLRKIYGEGDEFKKALRRHLLFFNTHMWVVGPILGTVASLEARRAKGEDIDEQTIQAVKSGLMGPLAGIGDSMFHGTWRPLMGGIAASLALQGNPIAPWFFFISVNVVHFYVRWAGLSYGYKFGDELIERMESIGIKRLMEGMAMAGLMALGALVGTWLNVKTPLTYTVQKATVSVQTMLNGIMPKLLPLLLVLLVLWMVRRKMKTVHIMGILVAASLILGGLGILG